MAAPVRTTRARRGAGRVTSPPVWHTALLEAIAAAKRGYHPERAMDTVALMEWLPDTQAAIADLYAHLGKQSVDMVDLPASTAEFFTALGAQQAQQHKALATAMSACLASVQDRIARIVNARQKDAAWDVSKHKGARW